MDTADCKPMMAVKSPSDANLLRYWNLLQVVEDHRNSKYNCLLSAGLVGALHSQALATVLKSSEAMLISMGQQLARYMVYPGGMFTGEVEVS